MFEMFCVICRDGFECAYVHRCFSFEFTVCAEHDKQINNILKTSLLTGLGKKRNEILSCLYYI